MLKKVMCYLFTLALLVAMAVLPVSADSEALVFDKDYGNTSFKGSSKDEGDLPIKSDYAGNLTFEVYVKINDFNTPTVIAGAWGEALHGYAFWCNAGALYFSSADTNGNNSISFPASVTADWAGKWLHLVGIKDGSTNMFYCNVEGSDEYEEDTVSRTTDHVYTDATKVLINGAGTEKFDGTGDFVLGSVRVYNANMNDSLEDMRAECEERVANAGEGTPDGGPTGTPAGSDDGSPTGTPSGDNSNGPTDNGGTNNGGTNNGGNKVDNTKTFDLGIVSLAAVALSSVVAVKKRK